MQEAELKKKELEKLKEFVKKILPNDWDKVDVEAEFDSSLSYKENKSILIDKLKILLGQNVKEEKEKYEAYQEEQKALNDKKIKEEIRKAESEVEEYNKRTYVPNAELDTYYSGLIRGVNKLCMGYGNLLFVKGPGGIGKSYNLKKAIIQNKKEFVEIKGDVSEAYLYRIFYENNGKIIWFSDLSRLLRGLKSINLIKAACESQDKRILTNANYSKVQSDLPKNFLWDGKIIFDYNSLQGLSLKEDFEALKTRGDYIELSFSFNDMAAIMKLIAKDNKELMEVTNHLLENYNIFQGAINLRSQWRAFNTYNYATALKLDWKEEIRKELTQNMSPVRSLLYNLIGTKAIRTTELKKILLKLGYVETIRTADRKINDWLITEEIFRWSTEDKNFYISINQKQ